jgi:two-component system KDP operon response regulator KdpE
VLRRESGPFVHGRDLLGRAVGAPSVQLWVPIFAVTAYRSPVVTPHRLDDGDTFSRMQSHPRDARRALVLHDQPLVVDLIELTLNHGLFVVRGASSLAEAQAILADWQPHLTVVDMDHDDSTALLHRLGASNELGRRVTPILGLTRRGDLKTKLRAFDLGVADILTVPFSPEELLARSIVVTRRAWGADAPLVPTMRLGEIEVDIVHRQVRAGRSIIHLSGIEQSLLYLLASRAGKVVTRDEILDAIWGTDFIAASNVVDRHVRSLRIKLQDDHRRPRFIVTVPGKGYRFIPTASDRDRDGRSQRDRVASD